MNDRQANFERKSTETQIQVNVNLDGEGESNINTSISFLDHMLVLFSRHSKVDVDLNAAGDTQVDYHHTVEDVGICLGNAIKDALGDKKGITRYGSCLMPMDETLVSVALDISARPYLVYNIQAEERVIKDFDVQLIEEFLRAFAFNLGLTLHINLNYGKNDHHVFEAVFKGLAVALRQAVTISGDQGEVPSSKGLL